MASKPPLPREEVLRILARLSPLSGAGRIILIGGQAVAWNRHPAHGAAIGTL